jgi:hypothetical protein
MGLLYNFRSIAGRIRTSFRPTAPTQNLAAT